MSSTSSTLCYLLLGGLFLATVQVASGFELLACDSLSSSMAISGNAAFKTIGQLDKYLVILTKTDLYYRLPLSTSLTNSSLSVSYIASSVTLADQWPMLVRDPINAGSFAPSNSTIALQLPGINSSLIAFGHLHSSRTKFSFTPCHIDSPECSTSVYNLILPKKFDANFAFLNSHEPWTFYALNSFDEYGLVKYVLEADSKEAKTFKVKPAAPKMHLCLNQDHTELTVSNEPCMHPQVNLIRPFGSFTGFTTPSHLYIVDPDAVYITEMPLKFDTTQPITQVPLDQFIGCHAPNVLTASVFALVAFVIFMVTIVCCFTKATTEELDLGKNAALVMKGPASGTYSPRGEEYLDSTV